jgi:DtxR family manganese transport transcriptional regulator
MPQPNSFSSAQRHRRVRRQHTDELAEDYAEAIYRLIQDTGSARVMELAEDFGVSHVSVIRALRRFESQSLLTYSRESGALLTPDGERLAKRAADRHDTLVRLFRALGVSEVQADADAEGSEHHLSHETFEAIHRFLDARETL